jgi:hypothetical protein
MLVFDDTTFGTQQCTLDLLELYPTNEERDEFCGKYDAFLKSDPFLSGHPEPVEGRFDKLSAPNYFAWPTKCDQLIIKTYFRCKAMY